MTRRALTEEQSLAILLPVWKDTVKVFARQGHSELGLAKFELDESMHDTERHFAGTTLDGKEMHVAPALVDMPLDTVEAILAHEAGHVVDFCNPGRWWFRLNELRYVADLPTKGLRKLLLSWKERDEDEVEHVADAIAELVTGRRIGYVGVGSCIVQTWDRGTPRPDGLR